MPAQSLPDQPAEPLAPREESSQGKKDDTLSAGPPAPRQRVTSNHPVLNHAVLLVSLTAASARAFDAVKG